jgi:hypothetical protein
LIETIVAEIDAEILRLNQVKALLTSAASLKRGPGRPPKADAVPRKSNRRRLSAAAREKIRQAQLKRWAATRRDTKVPAK